MNHLTYLDDTLARADRDAADWARADALAALAAAVLRLLGASPSATRRDVLAAEALAWEAATETYLQHGDSTLWDGLTDAHRAGYLWVLQDHLGHEPTRPEVRAYARTYDATMVACTAIDTLTSARR